MTTKDEMERYIEEGIDALEPRYREKIQNVAILLEDEPSREVRTREGLGPSETLMGLYHGVPLSERGDSYGVGETLPDTITLYRKPIFDEASETDGDVARVVRETIWHEFGHYFGLDEHEVRARERTRDEK